MLFVQKTCRLCRQHTIFPQCGIIKRHDRKSSCGQTEDLGNTQMDAKGSTAEISEENPQAVSDEAEPDSTEEETHDYDVDAEREHLLAEYNYSLDGGTGKLTIEKTSYGYDISDYESESTYRFLADSSNIKTIEDNRIYIKYPNRYFLMARLFLAIIFWNMVRMKSICIMENLHLARRNFYTVPQRKWRMQMQVRKQQQMNSWMHLSMAK